jgi:hypothetical protein
MGERAFRSWWRSRLPDLSIAVSRFPLAVAIAALLTFYKLFTTTGISSRESWGLSLPRFSG